MTRNANTSRSPGIRGLSVRHCSITLKLDLISTMTIQC